MPIVIIVFYLLVSADEVFAQLFHGLTEYIVRLFQTEEIFYLILRIIVIGILSIYFASFCYNISLKSVAQVEEKQNKKLSLQYTTLNTIYTMLNVIYLIFSVIQFTHLFTKAGVSDNFNYAEYARQGFFQLMFVSFINFAMIFISEINTKEVSAKQENYHRIMTVAMAIFTGIIVISAFMRMNIYQIEYGYTYLRLFVYTILITEFVLLIPTVWHLIGKKINMLKTTILILSIAYVILNYINIDRVIASKNINRYFENPEKDIDFSYLKYSTGIDAIPELTRLLETEDKTLKKDVIAYLQYAKSQINGQKRTWQEYNLAEEEAKELLNNLEGLE